MLNRRAFVFSLFCAPAIIRPGLIMPIKPIVTVARYPGEIDLKAGRDLAYWIERLRPELTMLDTEIDPRNPNFARKLTEITHDNYRRFRTPT